MFRDGVIAAPKCGICAASVLNPANAARAAAGTTVVVTRSVQEWILSERVRPDYSAERVWNVK